MDKKLHAQQWNYLSIPNFHVIVWEHLSKSIPHFIMDVITYPCWGLSWAMLVKGATDIKFLNHKSLILLEALEIGRF